MFRNAINRTALTTPEANDCMQNIRGESYGTDSTFIATLRALLHNRMTRDDELLLTFSNSDYAADTIANYPTNRMVEAIGGNMENQHDLVKIHSLRGSNEADIMANFRLLETSFCEINPGYERLEKMAEFYRRAFRVDCYINRETKCAVVYVENLDMKKMHYLQASILAFLPWYFNPDEGLSDNELGLLHSLRETTGEGYMKYIEAIASEFDLRSMLIRKQLANFESFYERAESERVKQQVETFEVQIREHNATIGSLYRQACDAKIRLAGLLKRISEISDESEIMDYFLCNKKLHLIRANSDYMTFCVKDYLTYFDKEMAEKLIANHGSYLYPYSRNNGLTKDDIELLLREIFVSDEPQIRILFAAAYSFDLRGNVEPLREFDFPASMGDCMPNTHIDYYTCMGMYLKTINELLEDRDYIGAIEQCVASCKSLNFGDSVVMERFMAQLWDNEYTCFELPDGSVVNTSEAIRWLKEKKNSASNITEEAAINE